MNKAAFETSLPNEGVATEQGRMNLRTLVLIRWIAVAGQAATVLIVYFVLRFSLPLLLSLGVVGVSALLNIVTTLRGAARLNERDATIYLSYDLIQLGALLYLTGGLQNPFSVLLLAPVTVGASILSRSRIAILASVAVLIGSMLAVWHLPLPWASYELTIPPIYIIAVWMALGLSTVFITAYIWNVTEDGRRLNQALNVTQMALAREQRVSAVGALAAAAAHELGSPLGTIAVIARELVRDLPPDSPYNDDAQLLLSETARCRTILAGLSNRSDVDGRSPFETLPVSALIEASGDAHSAELHHANQVTVTYHAEGDPAGEPFVRRWPEIIHGIGNMVQNAIQFAQSRVEVTTSWDKRKIMVEIQDDGPGFAPYLLSRLGQPYVSGRNGDGEHMGLGIFIAETLLRRTGAEPTYENGPDEGAFVRVVWSRASLEAPPPSEGGTRSSETSPEPAHNGGVAVQSLN